MRIGIFGFLLSRKYKWLSNYIFLYNMLENLEKIDKKNEYIIYINDELSINLIRNPKWKFRLCKGIFYKSGIAWQLLQANKYLLNDKIDIFWVPQNIIIGNFPKSVMKVLTVHDIKWRINLLALPWDALITEKIFAKQSIFTADHVVVPTCSIRNKIKQFVCKDIEFKSSVVNYGVSDDFKPIDKDKAIGYISKKYETAKNFILHVSVPSPIKNLKNLLYGFKYLLSKGIEIQLLIAGGYGWRVSEVYKVYRKLQFTEKQVKFLGYVPSIDLPRLYSAAKAFVTVSLEEGFGFPVIESIKCGTPVVCSNIDTLKEILGDCAIYVNPYDISDIAKGLYDIIIDKNLNDNLIILGIERSRIFSWSEAASKIIDIFNKLYSKRNENIIN